MFESDTELDDDYLNDEALVGKSPLKDHNREREPAKASTTKTNEFTIEKKEYKEDNPLSEATFHQPPSKSFAEVFGKTVVKRRFPGPAGLLPNTHNPHQKSSNHLGEVSILSQKSNDIFESSPWQMMWKDYQHLLRDSFSLPERFTINRICNLARCSQLLCKPFPFLACILQSVEIKCKQLSNVNLVLKDMTGTIPAAMHGQLYMKYAEKLKPQCVLVLVNFGVLSSVRCTHHCLIINSKNLLSIYHQAEDGAFQVEKIEHLSEAEGKIAIEAALMDIKGGNKKRKPEESLLGDAVDVDDDADGDGDGKRTRHA